MTEVRTAILIIIGITIAIGMAAIFAGCNEAFSNVDHGVSSAKICEGYSTARASTTLYSPFEKCLVKQNERENLCIDYFSWLKFTTED